MKRITLGRHSKMYLYFDKCESVTKGLVAIKMSNKDYIRNVLKREIKNPVCEDGYYTGGCMYLDDLPIMYDKLQCYEDIEEELNTNFIILGKAKQNGIYRRLNDEVEYISPSEMTIYIDHIMTESGKQLYLYEYGQDWALTKRELENCI